MAKIISFQESARAEAAGSFADESETLCFKLDRNGETRLGILPPAGSDDVCFDPDKDWSNQELASLFRVDQLLKKANVATITDRGVSDEGDPWFLFCHATGEVFIHLCRIDGVYILDNPNIQKPLRGSDFNELIADFTNRALPQPLEERDGGGRRVIRLERGGKVSLHPSAMLAALIWTLFIASEELVLLAPEEEEFSHDDLVGMDEMLAGGDRSGPLLDVVPGLELDTPAELAADDTDNQSVEFADTPGQLREALTGSLQSQGIAVTGNSYAMGLSTIAIGLGVMSEAVFVDNYRVLADVLNGADQSRVESDNVDVAESSTTEQSETPADIVLAFVEFLGFDADDQSLVSDLPAPELTPSETEMVATAEQHQGQVDELLTFAIALDDQLFSAPDSAEQSFVDLAELGEVVDEGSTSPIVNKSSSDADTAMIDGPSPLTSLTSSDLVDSWDHEFQEFDLGDTSVLASFVVSSGEVSELVEMVDATTNNRTTSFREFDEAAQRLIDYIDAKEGEMGIIDLGTEIIMIDRSAVSEGRTDFRNWETADGVIISVVGLASDLEKFDVVA